MTAISFPKSNPSDIFDLKKWNNADMESVKTAAKVHGLNVIMTSDMREALKLGRTSKFDFFFIWKAMPGALGWTVPRSKFASLYVNTKEDFIRDIIPLILDIRSKRLGAAAESVESKKPQSKTEDGKEKDSKAEGKSS